MIWRFVDNNRKLWGQFDEKEKAIQFLQFVKTLNNYTDFTIVRYNDIHYPNGEIKLHLSAIIPIIESTENV